MLIVAAATFVCVETNLRLISRSNFGSFFRCTSACVWMVVTPSIPSKNSIGWTVCKHKSIGSDNKSWWSLHLNQETCFFTLEPAVAKCQNQERIVTVNGGTHLMSETFTDFIGITPMHLKAETRKTLYSSAAGVRRSQSCLSLLPGGSCASRTVRPSTEQVVWYLAFRPLMNETHASMENMIWPLCVEFARVQNHASMYYRSSRSGQRPNISGKRLFYDQSVLLLPSSKASV